MTTLDDIQFLLETFDQGIVLYYENIWYELVLKESGARFTYEFQQSSLEGIAKAIKDRQPVDYAIATYTKPVFGPEYKHMMPATRWYSAENVYKTRFYLE